jgi:hypothetical protein
MSNKMTRANKRNEEQTFGGEGADELHFVEVDARVQEALYRRARAPLAAALATAAARRLGVDDDGAITRREHRGASIPVRALRRYGAQHDRLEGRGKQE